MTPHLFALLMRDAARLLRPAAVVSLSTAPPDTSASEIDQHPSISALLALSDLSSLFQSQQANRNSSKRSPPDPCTAKLTFYAARIIHTPTYIMNALCNEAMARASLVEREGLQEQGSVPLVESGSATRQGPDVHVEENRPRIEELP